jgi:peptide methionine sulfoxide reductase MsrA
MTEIDVLTAAQLREAAEVLRAWAAERQHDAQVAAEVIDQAAFQEAEEATQRVEAVREALLAAAIRRDADPAAQAAAAAPDGTSRDPAR